MRNRRWLALIASLSLSLAVLLTGQGSAAGSGQFNTSAQAQATKHEAVFTLGPSFNVSQVTYPSSHDFDRGSGTDTCLSVSVPPGDIFTLTLTWEALVAGPQGAGDLDLYLYGDSSCTPSSLVTSSFNSNAYTEKLLEITPQVRNIGSATAIAGVRIGRRTGRGIPGLLSLSVSSGAATFAEHGTDGPPLEGQEGAPVFTFTGPFEIAENSPAGTAIGTVTATDPQSDPLTFFELEPAVGQESFQVNALTGAITVEDPAALDRETSASVAYWIGVTDGVSASVISVGISLAGVNDNPPVALNGSVYTTPGTPVSIALTGSDADIDPAQQLVMSVSSPPANGSLGPLTPVDNLSSTVTYTPAPGFIGTDTFTFDANDGDSTSAPATITVFVSDELPTATPGASATVTATPTGGVNPTATPGAGGGGGGSGVIPIPLPTAGAQQPAVVPPSAPRFLRAEAGDAKVTLTWQRPLSDGGAPIDGYRVFNINTARPTIFAGDITGADVLDLANGTGYLFQVQAFNAAGVGEAALVGPVTPVSGQPDIIEVDSSLHPDDTFSIWWSAPTGNFLEPITEYQLWLEGGELLDTILPGQPLFANVTDLEPDAWHSFRVSAFDEDGEIVATGLTDPLYLPPTLASMFDPLPADAVLVDITDATGEGLQTALRSAVSTDVVVSGDPAIVTVRDGEAAIFIAAEGLHRAVVLPPDFTVESEQWSIGAGDNGGLAVELEIEPGVWVVGEAQTEADSTGLLFTIPDAAIVLRLGESVDGELAPVDSFEIDYGPLTLLPGYTFEASAPVELPAAVSEALAHPSVEEVATVIEVSHSGLVIAGTPSETVTFIVETFWHDWQLAAGRQVSITRTDSNGETVTVAADCEPYSPFDPAVPSQPALSICRAVFDGEGGPTAHYTLISGVPGIRPTPTPAPTTVSAPSDAPTATPGSSFVVVEPTATPGGSSSGGPLPLPTATVSPTPSDPVLPESDGGGTSAVTWLLGGLLGLVVIRGAFYAVGRIKS